MKQKLNENQESATVQSAEQNDQSAATSRKNIAPAPHKEPASGELAAAPCSAFRNASEEQNSEMQRVSIRIGDEIVTITVQKTQEYTERQNRIKTKHERARSIAEEEGVNFDTAYMKATRELLVDPESPEFHLLGSEKEQKLRGKYLHTLDLVLEAFHKDLSKPS